MTIRRQRAILVGSILFFVALATGLALRGLEENVSFYRTPTQLLAEHNRQQSYRVGGLVARGSVVHGAADAVIFRVTDTETDLTVQYNGALPDLFREGQGIVVEGRLQPDGSLRADQVLAKHDERYMPPEAARALEAAQRKQP